MDGFWTEAASLLLRWLHVVAAIAWIGESFYFVMLDRSLKPPREGAAGVLGEMWSVHGGGFYHQRKFLTAPGVLPAELHWSMWKSYTTWLSGFALLAVLYLASPRMAMVDPSVAALSDGQAIAAALGLLVGGWLAYDLACRLAGFRDRILAVVVALLVVALAWTATQLFAGRAAFLLVGATLATIMSANVFFVIIPGQRRMVAALARGETPDPLPGRRGKQRSVHNTYFTLPVVFAMLSVHHAAAHAHPWNWAVLLGFMAAGAAIRQFFVLWHSGGRAWWLLGVGGVLLAAMLAWIAPRPRADEPAPTPTTAPAPTAARTWPETPTTADLMPLVHRHCAEACHAARPKMMPAAPKGYALDTEAQLEQLAPLVHQQAVVTRVMPPGNLTGMTEDERAAIDRWFRARSP